MKLVKINNRRLNLYFTHKELIDEKINLDKMLIDKQTCNTYLNDIISILNTNNQLSLDKESLIFQIFPLVEGDLLVSVIKKDEKIADFVYKFDDFEDIIFVFENFSACFSGFSSLYTFKNEYYLVFEKRYTYEILNSWILGEFGEKARINKAFLAEQGTLVIKDNAQEIILKYFSKGLKN